MNQTPDQDRHGPGPRSTPDVRENGREVRRLMRSARSQGAEIVHFAEAAMSGCSKAQIKDW